MKKSFYLKPYLRASALFNLVAIGVLVALLASVWGLVTSGIVPWLARANSNGSVWLVLGLVTIVLVIAILVMGLFAVSHLVSRLEVSDEGLDYLFFPYLHFRAAWDDVQELQTRREIVTADVILLKHATNLGVPLTMMLRKQLGMDLQYFVPLNILDGYPEGELKTALVHYAPRLFADKGTS